MISAISVVWAIMASITIHQRERDLRKVHADLLDARERIKQLTDAPAPDSEPVMLEEPLDLDALENELPVPPAAPE